MGISVLLLLVNLPQADADLCGDEIFLEVKDANMQLIHSDSGIVKFTGSFDIVPGIDISFQVFCDEDLDGDSLIFFDYTSSNSVPTDVPEHSFWFTDLMWTNQNGKVVDFQVEFSNLPNIMSIGFTDTSVHATSPGFTMPASPANTDSNLIIFSSHNGNGNGNGMAVGGELISLDSTMILAAGAQYTAAWMIPVLVSAVGIGIVIARKF